METFRELGKKYQATKFCGDEYPGQTFEDIYEDVFAPYRMMSPLKVLEIGIQGGGSLRVWRDYFPHAQIVGIDIDKKSIYQEDRIFTYLVNQADENAMNALIERYNGFDIVIDDGGHYSKDQIITLKLLLSHTKYLYCIEDLDTAYSDLYPELTKKGETSIVDVVKQGINSVVIGNGSIERIDFRKRYVGLYKRQS